MKFCSIQNRILNNILICGVFVFTCNAQIQAGVMQLLLFWMNYPAGVVLNCISLLLPVPTSLFVPHEKIITYLRSWIASQGCICYNSLIEYLQNSCSERLYLSNLCQWEGIWIKQKQKRGEAPLTACMQMLNLNYVPAAQRIFRGREMVLAQSWWLPLCNTHTRTFT